MKQPSIEWVKFHRTGFRLKRWVSTRERRLFYTDGGEITIKPPGRYTPGFLVQGIGYISMLPQLLSLAIEAPTKDGILLRTRWSAELAAMDTEEALRRIVLDPSGQEQLLAKSIESQFRLTSSKFLYDELPSSLSEVVNEVISTLGEESRSGRNAFRVQRLLLHEWAPQDTELARISLEKIRLQEQTALQAAQLESERQLAVLKAEREAVQAEAHAKVERLRLETELAAARARAEANASMQMNDLKVKEETARVAQLPEGRTVLFPRESFGLETERVRAIGAATKRLDPLLMKFAVQGAMAQGQVETLRAVLEKQYGISINSPFELLPEGGEAQELDTEDAEIELEDEELEEEI